MELKQQNYVNKEKMRDDNIHDNAITCSISDISAQEHQGAGGLNGSKSFGPNNNNNKRLFSVK